MAIKASPSEFDIDACDPNDNLLRHNAAVRENLVAIVELKEAIQEGDDERAAQAWLLIKEDVREALWVAPTKGGIFTTSERSYIQSSEMQSAASNYIAENGK